MTESLQWAALLAIILNNIGKSCTHALKNADHTHWARRPIVPGLAISDAYHLLSGVMWLALLQLAWASWGWDWRWWLAMLIATGLVWPLSKRLKGLSWREAALEAWYVQLIRYAFDNRR